VIHDALDRVESRYRLSSVPVRFDLKLKYSYIVTFLLVWGTVMLVRVTAERDQ